MVEILSHAKKHPIYFFIMKRLILKLSLFSTVGLLITNCGQKDMSSFMQNGNSDDGINNSSNAEQIQETDTMPHILFILRSYRASISKRA